MLRKKYLIDVLFHVDMKQVKQMKQDFTLSHSKTVTYKNRVKQDETE